MLDYELIDDGTIDTVVEVRCMDCGRTWTERFSDTFDYRDEDGDLDLAALMDNEDIGCEQCED